MNDSEFILVNKICKDCGRTYEILVRYETIHEPNKELYQCFNCYSVDYMSDEPDEDDFYDYEQ